MKKIALLFLLTISLNIFCQKKYAKEFGFVNDNDLYISTSKDRYYTNGIFFSYRYLKESSNKKIDKKIFQFQLGHHMYTPFKAIVDLKEAHDRPFAGYLYGSFGVEYFLKNNTALKINTQIGMIGSNAFGRELQGLIHDIYGFKKAIGWKYQIANAFAFNVEGEYIKSIWMSKDNNLDVNWVSNAKAGSVFTNVSTSLYTRIGFVALQNLVNSISFGSNLNNNLTAYDNKVEAYFYFKPTVSYVIYDATIQGSFLNDNNPVTFEIENTKFTGELGLRFTANRFNLGYSFFFHSKKLKSVRVPNTNFYGRLTINYQFN